MKNKTRKNKTHKNKNPYSKKHYSSGEGMVTKIWGPALWHSLHTISFNYPVNPSKNDKIYYKQFILNLQHVLPCKLCRINFKNNIKHHPLRLCDLENRRSFSMWVYKLHEYVNKMLGKKSNLTYCDVRERYEHFRARCTKEKLKLFKFTRKKKEDGCVDPLYGYKSKSIIQIIPDNNKRNTIQIDKKCLKFR